MWLCDGIDERRSRSSRMAGQQGVAVKPWPLLSYCLVINTILLSAYCHPSAANQHHEQHEVPNFEAAFQGKCGPKSPCVQLCVELHDGTFECQCRAGYRLLQDGYSCVEAVNTSTSEEDSEEEWIRRNSIQNRLIHEHHDQQRDLQLNNYRRSQAAASAVSSSRLSYYPFSGKSESESNNYQVTTATTAASSSSGAAVPSEPLRPDETNSIDESKYVHSAGWKLMREEEDAAVAEIPGSVRRSSRIQTTPFSFASKFTFDSHELPTLYGRPNNDEKIREALLFTSSERRNDDDDDSREDDNNDGSDSSEEDSDEEGEDEGGSDDVDDDDDEDEDEDDVEIDQIFQNNLKFLKDKIESESRRMRRKQVEQQPVQADAPSSITVGRDPLAAMNSNLDERVSDHDSALARPTWSSSAEEQAEEERGRVGQVPSVSSTTSFPTTTTPTTTTTPATTASTTEQSEDAEAAAGPDEMPSNDEPVAPSSSVATSSVGINQKCPLQCKNGGWCDRDGRFGVNTAEDAQSLEEKLAGYRCLCPMGYSGSFCEIEDGSAAADGGGDAGTNNGNGEGGYDSGLFRGQSWVAFPVLHDAYMSDQISLEFRPEVANGILLVTGERDDLSGDFLALYVRDGYLEFRFDCGSGSGMVRSSQPVKLQQWNRASIVRRRWEGWMQLNEGPFTQGRSKGLFSRITFRQPVFIGGAGNITFGSSSGLSGESNEGIERNRIEESELETEGPLGAGTAVVEAEQSSVADMKINEKINSTSNSHSPDTEEEQDPMTTSLPTILRKVGGFRGCIRNLIINERNYRFGLEPGGDALQGFDIENCNDQGVCDLLNCQHGGQCIVQTKDENPTCLCPLGYAGHFCETPLDLQIPSFNGSSYLKYGGLGLSRVLSWLELEVIVKPDAMDGLILYNGYKTDGMGDFISLVIDQGYFEFAMDLGTGTAIIRSDYPVVLSEWHRILISRTSRLISMRIDNQSPLMALTPGAFTQLSLPHNLFLGGIPDPQWLSPKVKVHTGFSGCIQKLVINGKPLRIMGSAMSGVNLENCAHPCLRNPCDHGGECVPQMDSFKCHCPLGYRDSFCQSRMDKQDVITAPKLIGDSYLKFTHPRIIKRISGSRLNLSFRIRTSLSRGLILWAGRKLMTSASDFLSLALRNGFIHASFSLGSGQTTIAYNYTAVHDGHWHLVRFVRNEQEASLYVDDGPPVIGVAPGKLRQLNINDGLYIGGLDDPRHQSLNKYSEGLVGCITDLILGNDYRVALLQDASEGRNVDYCD